MAFAFVLLRNLLLAVGPSPGDFAKATSAEGRSPPYKQKTRRNIATAGEVGVAGFEPRKTGLR